MRGRFILDFITILPLYKVLHPYIEFSRLFYMIKLIRLYRGLELLNTKEFMRHIKQYTLGKIKKVIRKHPNRAKDKTINHNHIQRIVLTSYIVRTLKLLIITCSFSYFFGLFWYIFCDIRLILQKRDTSLFDKDFFGENEDENFLVYFQLYNKSVSENLITMTYFAFTTLTTVGLGDFHPRTNIERALGAFVMLFGVIVTSFITESFTKMILIIKEFQKDYEDNLALSTFIATIQRFNDGNKINPERTQSIKDYFEYRWKKNRNFAVSTTYD